MATVIATNVLSLQAQKNLNTTSATLAQSMERISSGLRINSAKDDAAGMAIGSRMTSQINGNTQAMRNASDGISLAQTAEGSLQAVTDSLQRMRTLAVQSANASNSTLDRAAIQNEVNQLVAQINTVAGQAAFNGVKLLDGTFNSQTFQTGANAGETIVVSQIASAKADSLGVGTTSSFATNSTGVLTAGNISAGGIAVNGFSVAATVRDGVSNAGSNDSAIAKAAAFNAISGQSGVTASAVATSVTGVAATTFTAIAGTAADSLYVNGINIGAVAAGGNAIGQGVNVSAAINAVTNQTGVSATFNTTTGAISLTAADGRNISLMSGTGGTTAAKGGFTAATYVAAGVVSANSATTFTALKAGDLTINGYDVGAVAAGTDSLTQTTNVAAAINALTSKTGVVAAAAAGVITLTTTATGQDISISGSVTNQAATATATGFSAAQMNSNSSSVTRGNIKLTSTGSAGITLGGADIARVGLATGYTAATSTFGSGISTLDVSTAAGASNAIATIDAALGQVNTSRASLGAYQNRFGAAVANLETTTVNVSASRSRITDADFASETATTTRSQIMQQAGTAMLAQANQSGQSVLSLLK